MLRFVVPTAGRVRLDIFDLRGVRVATLVDRDFHTGEFSALWSGVDDRGRRVASGVYMARLSAAGGHRATGKLVLLK